MGLIRMSDLPLLRPQQIHRVHKEKADVEHVEVVVVEQLRTQDPGSVSQRDDLQQNSDVTYPILSGKTAEKDLPFITPVEIGKRDGQGINRLCTYQLPTSNLPSIPSYAHILVGIVVDGIVLDCTEYCSRHPGGRMIIQGFGGQDASWQWWSFHDQEIWKNVAMGLPVGRTEGVENKHTKPPSFVGIRSFGYQDE